MGFGGGGGEEGVWDYSELPREGARVGFDEEVGGAWCEGGDGGWVSFDDVRAVGMKAGFVRREGLGGLFYWAGTGDRMGGGSLVEAGWRGLGLGNVESGNC